MNLNFVYVKMLVNENIFRITNLNNELPCSPSEKFTWCQKTQDSIKHWRNKRQQKFLNAKFVLPIIRQKFLCLCFKMFQMSAKNNKQTFKMILCFFEKDHMSLCRWVDVLYWKFDTFWGNGTKIKSQFIFVTNIFNNFFIKKKCWYKSLETFIILRFENQNL
jgi:hypothetical protein